MGLAEQRAKSAKMAKDLIARGYPHGRRMSQPFPNSGGLTMVNLPGSARYQRLTERWHRANQAGNHDRKRASE